jgi:hypothetical protein
MTSQTPSETTGQLTSGPVLLDVSDGVATITLNRPEAMNSLDIATKEILVEVVRQVSEDPSVRCVVLTGTGRAFCTGQDLKEHINLLETGGSDQLFTTVEKHYNPIVSTIMAMDKPVIAAVNGVAAGAWRWPATCGSSPTRPASTWPSRAWRFRATPARASACRCSWAAPRRSSCSTSRAPCPRPRPSRSASRRPSSPPTTWPARSPRWPPGSRPAPRVPTARCAAR